MELTLLLPKAREAVGVKAISFIINLSEHFLSFPNTPQMAPWPSLDFSPSCHYMAKKHEMRAFPHLKAHSQGRLLGLNMFSTYYIRQGLAIREGKKMLI